jgi:hypothetical protein
MATAYGMDRCDKSSWRGKVPAPGRNRCVTSKGLPHSTHRDECGNNFIIRDGVPHVVDHKGKELN